MTTHSDGSESLEGDESVPLQAAEALHPSTRHSSERPTISSRVCDRCITKKVKCDLKRPRCSRCLETDVDCVYSTVKKRPGPRKGSQPRKRSRLEPSDVLTADSEVGRETPGLQGLPQIEDVTIDTLMFMPTSSTTQLTSSAIFVDVQLSPFEERSLLENFFQHIHPCIPLFHKDEFLAQYDAGTISPNLLRTLLCLSAKILGRPSSWSEESLQSNLEFLLAIPILDDDSPSELPCLDEFQLGCLLAFYEFHQKPGEKSWHRIGHLTRKAVRLGLDQLDNEEDILVLEYYRSPAQVDCWRQVWWCLYRLDSYSNITAATPFMLPSTSVRTALPMKSLPEVVDFGDRSDRLIFLAEETSQLWLTIREITSQPGDINDNVHIVSTAILRESATNSRLLGRHASQKLARSQAALDDDLAAIRMALPPFYMEPTRIVEQNESNLAHQARLICILHLHMARIFHCLPLKISAAPGDASLDRWRRVSQYCQDVVSVIKQWDSRYSTSTDPAICFIVFAVLFLLQLQAKSEPISDPETQPQLAMQINILLLFLEQFASFWHLPEFLSESYQQVCSTFGQGPLSVNELERVTRNFKTPLQKSWSRTLKQRQQQANFAVEGYPIDSSSFGGDWDLSNWFDPSDFTFLRQDGGPAIDAL